MDGTAWCDICPPEDWPEAAHYFPAGELARIELDSLGEVVQ